MGQKLSELRQNGGYTSYESFALDIDMSRMQYWRIEKGQLNITINTLDRLVSFHGLTVEDFFLLMAKDSRSKK